MFSACRSASFSLAVAAGLAAGPANAEIRVKLEEFATGLNAPLAMVQPPGDDRYFVIEQFGRVQVLDSDGELGAQPVLDIRNKIVDQFADFDERGLLGIAFHPQFQDNGKFYVSYSARLNFQGTLDKMFWWDHTNVVEEYVMNDDDATANASAGRIVSSIDWPQFNHNGHWIAFGPDDMLYISTGDGGYANDWGIGHNVTEGNGQDLTSLHGKILRIDVDGDAPYGIPDDNPFVDDGEARPEIWAYGLRNPWRCSFDMEGGDLICGDVQQNSYEEVNLISAGDNLGWRVKEATHCFDYAEPNSHPESCEDEGMVDPILEYKNCTAVPVGCQGISVTGGYVYRGAHEPWNGTYFFGDWSKSFGAMDGQLFAATKGDGDEWTMEEVTVEGMEGPIPYVLAFAQDAEGEVYVLTSVTTGPVGGMDTIYKIVPAGD